MLNNLWIDEADGRPCPAAAQSPAQVQKETGPARSELGPSYSAPSRPRFGGDEVQFGLARRVGLDQLANRVHAFVDRLDRVLGDTRNQVRK